MLCLLNHLLGGPSLPTVVDETICHSSVIDASKIITSELSTNEVEQRNVLDDVVQRATPAEIREQKRLDELNDNISFLMSKQQKGLGDSEARR